jgi:hypothetical protein
MTFSEKLKAGRMAGKKQDLVATAPIMSVRIWSDPSVLPRP